MKIVYCLFLFRNFKKIGRMELMGGKRLSHSAKCLAFGKASCFSGQRGTTKHFGQLARML